jgi:uncharacterized GH25 family protein
MTRALLLFLCLALAVVLIAAPPPMTTLTISVKTQSNKPVDNASVIVKFVQGRNMAKLGKSNTLEWEMHTNQEGSVKIPPIPQGKILIQVIAKNYQTFGQTIDVRLNPPQSQYSAH